MTHLTCFAEAFSANGNLASEGLKNQLGRPRLDLLEVLVRETVQNSWDARVRDSKRPVCWAVRSWLATDSQLRAINNEVFLERPPEPESGISLSDSIDPAFLDEEDDGYRPLRLLTITDRGTNGLGGPVRADEWSEDEDEPRDFVDFLRNIGHPPDRQDGGGTFGYGKAVLYLVSRPSTIVAYTRCRYRGRYESRLIAAGIGSMYRQKEGRKITPHTGRHWWGEQNDVSVVDPLTGRRADDLAKRLGLEPFGEDELGTTILLIDPDFGERTPREAFEYLADATLWNFWPKMLTRPEQAGPSMTFSLTLDGVDVPIADPRSRPPLELFAGALLAIDEHRHGRPVSPLFTVRQIESGRPKQVLGWLAWKTGPVSPRAPQRPGNNAYDPPIGEVSSHIALMRAPRFVVKYLPCQPYDIDGIEYGGVFLSHEELDRYFADAEPPTHDDWLPSMLPKQKRTLVNQSLTKIKATLAERFRRTAGAAPSTRRPLGRLANTIGTLLSGVDGGSASLLAPIDVYGDPRTPVDDPPSQPGGPIPGGQPPAVPRGDDDDTRALVRSGEIELVELDGAAAFRVPFEVVRPGAGLLEVTIDVIVEGGRREKEGDAPEGAERPRLLRWDGPAAATVGENLDLARYTERSGAAFVSALPGVVAALGLEVRSGR